MLGCVRLMELPNHPTTHAGEHELAAPSHPEAAPRAGRRHLASRPQAAAGIAGSPSFRNALQLAKRRFQATGRPQVKRALKSRPAEQIHSDYFSISKRGPRGALLRHATVRDGEKPQDL